MKVPTTPTETPLAYVRRVLGLTVDEWRSLSPETRAWFLGQAVYELSN